MILFKTNNLPWTILLNGAGIVKDGYETFITFSTILFNIIPYPSSNIDSPLGLSFLLFVKIKIEKKNL